MSSGDMPWRDPPRLTEADRQRLDLMQDEEAGALDVTSDAHEYVWGFRQDRPEEHHRLLAGEASACREALHEHLAQGGHTMTWQLEDRGPGTLPAWQGECTGCGANASAHSGGTSCWRCGKDAREVTCSGPGTAWQDEMLRERQQQLIAGAVSQFGQQVKDICDRQWLTGQGLSPDGPEAG